MDDVTTQPGGGTGTQGVGRLARRGWSCSVRVSAGLRQYRRGSVGLLIQRGHRWGWADRSIRAAGRPQSARVDSDGDGLTDGFELATHTDPLAADSDGNGVADGAQFAAGNRYRDRRGPPAPPARPAPRPGTPRHSAGRHPGGPPGTAPSAPEPRGDRDPGTGVPDRRDRRHGPGASGGVTGDAGRSARHRSTPMATGSRISTRRPTERLRPWLTATADGLADGLEVTLGTDATQADSDHDGLSDGAEVRLGSDPLHAEPAADAPAARTGPAAGTPAAEHGGVPTGTGRRRHPAGRPGAGRRTRAGTGGPNRRHPLRPQAADPPAVPSHRSSRPTPRRHRRRPPLRPAGPTTGATPQVPTPATRVHGDHGDHGDQRQPDRHHGDHGHRRRLALSRRRSRTAADARALRMPARRTRRRTATKAEPSDVAHAKEVNQKFLDAAEKQIGDQYVFGVEVDVNNPDPKVFDCAELTKWAAHQAGTDIPGSSFEQYLDLKQKGLLIPVEEAKHIPGALLFHFSSEPRRAAAGPTKHTSRSARATGRRLRQPTRARVCSPRMPEAGSNTPRSCPEPCPRSRARRAARSPTPRGAALRSMVPTSST